jgi:predicted dehydrogenase
MPQPCVMGKRHRLGLVGTGWVTDRHLPALERLDRTELVGVVSATPGRAAAVTERWGGAAFATVDAMLDGARPDVVFVCQPPHRAALVLETLIARGLPFLTEKPLAATASDAERVGRLLEASPLVVAVGYQWRALDFLPAVRERLAARPARLVLARWTGDLPGPAWWRHAAESGGQVVEQATHLYDLARMLVGEARVVAAASDRAPRTGFPDADVDDLAAAVLRFETGGVGSFTNTSILASSVIELDLLADGARTTIRQDGLRWTLAVDDGAGSADVAVARDPYEAQAEAFLDAVDRGDAGAVLSSYADALRTDRLTRSVVAAAGSRG